MSVIEDLSRVFGLSEGKSIERASNPSTNHDVINFVNPLDYIPEFGARLDSAQTIVGKALISIRDSEENHVRAGQRFSLESNILSQGPVAIDPKILEKQRVQAEAALAMAGGDMFAALRDEPVKTAHLDDMIAEKQSDEDVGVDGEIASPEEVYMPAEEEALQRALAAASSNSVNASHYAPENIQT